MPSTHEQVAAHGFEGGEAAGKIPVFVINLDRSPERYACVAQSAARNDIQIERVSGIDGTKLDLASLPGVDPQTFSRVNGRPMLPGEAGCYLSHVKAIRTFLESDADMALICEDDVDFTGDTMPFLHGLRELKGWDVVKLFSFRTYGFRRHATVVRDISIGRCIAGPVGSSASYAISRDGAARLLQSLDPMIVPYDVALERGWQGPVRFFMTDRRAIDLQPEQTSTITSAGYRGKYPFYRRIGTLIFRAREYANRVVFAYRGTDLRKGAPSPAVRHPT